MRQITTYCNEAVCGRYRGEVCGYTGTARFTHDGKPTDDPTLDRCSGLLAHCKLRDNEGSFVDFLPLVWFEIPILVLYNLLVICIKKRSVNMKSIIALTLLFVLTACSTKPIVNYTETVSLVDNNVTSDRSTIVVRRDMGFMGSGCPVEIYLNGVKYARLQSSQSINIHTTAGTHILSAKFTGRGGFVRID